MKIGNAQGFWGDRPTAPAQLVEQQPDLDVLTLEYLAELTMSILAAQREKDSSKGYAHDFVDVIKTLVPFWEKGQKFKVVTNAGGLNPYDCAMACADVVPNKKIAVVSGDDVSQILKGGQANAYLGAKPIAEALQAGAEIVITGRVADVSLTVAPCVAHFGWKWDDYDKLAGATIAGHLIECGAQVTGGISTSWMSLSDLANIGYPVVEVQKDGSFVITKPPNTGGVVNEETVKEQLLYEIDDPDNFLSPDVTVSFLSLKLESDGPSRIRITGAKGKPPPSTYKVSTCFRDGYKSEAMLTIFGGEAAAKARRCGEIILERVRQQGYELEKTCIECLGHCEVVPGVITVPHEYPQKECVLRICVSDSRKEALECFVKEIAPLVTTGPQGITGYATGRPKIRPVFGYRPSSIESNLVTPKVELL